MKKKKNNKIKKFFERGDEKYPITFELHDGELMVNATQMGAAFGETRKPQRFLRNKQTLLFINQLRKEFDSNGSNLNHTTYIKEPVVVVGNDKRRSLRGTWMHQKLALKYASWIAPSFESWVYDNILTLLKTGKVELDRPMAQSMQEHLNHQTQRDNTKIVNREIYRQTKGDVGSIPKYHHNLTLKLTGITPKEWVKIGKESGLKKDVTSKGGKEVMRQLSPKFTCVMSLADNILSSQKHLSIKNDQQYVIDEVKKGIEMFDGLLKMGVKTPEYYNNKIKF